MSEDYRVRVLHSSFTMTRSLTALLMLTTLSLISTPEQAQARLALVFGGQGTESYDPTGSLIAAVNSARAAGFEVQIVKERLPEETLAKADVWIQPGGTNFNQAYDMQRSGLFEQVKKFVADGGGYVGFCAGAFMAQSYGSLGLGLLPGMASRYSKGAFKAEIIWNGRTRYVHFENGPRLQQIEGVEVFATYASNGAAAAGRGKYGKGTVVVTGVHPEALTDWWPTKDPDGLDTDLAAEMIREAAR